MKFIAKVAIGVCIGYVLGRALTRIIGLLDKSRMPVGHGGGPMPTGMHGASLMGYRAIMPARGSGGPVPTGLHGAALLGSRTNMPDESE